MAKVRFSGFIFQLFFENLKSEKNGFLNFHIFFLSETCKFQLFFKLAWLNRQFYQGMFSRFV